MTSLSLIPLFVECVVTDYHWFGNSSTALAIMSETDGWVQCTKSQELSEPSHRSASHESIRLWALRTSQTWKTGTNYWFQVQDQRRAAHRYRNRRQSAGEEKKPSLRLLTNFHHKKSFSDLFVFIRLTSWKQLTTDAYLTSGHQLLWQC